MSLTDRRVWGWGISSRWDCLPDRRLRHQRVVYCDSSLTPPVLAQLRPSSASGLRSGNAPAPLASLDLSSPPEHGRHASPG